MSKPILTITDLTSGYGNLQILNGVSLEVNQGEIYSLLGANGAGKTTFLGTVAGLIKANSGQMMFDGHDLSKIAPHKIPELGLVLVPEDRKLFSDLTVEENLKLGAYHPTARAKMQETLADMFEMFPRLAERKFQSAGSLSGGEQQMCAIARGLMALPKLLMMDEPSLGLAPIIVSQLFDLIPNLTGRGVTVLLIEQNVAEALNISSRGGVLEQGRLTIKGSAQELLSNPELQRAYLGVA